MHYMQVTKSGIYRFRVRVPSYARRFFKQKELNRSLRTKSYHSAQIKALLLYNRFQEILEAIRGHMLSDEQIQALIDEYIYIAMKVEDDIHLARKVPYKDKDSDVFLHEQQLQRSEEKLFEADIDSVQEAAEMLLETLGLTLDVDDAQHKRFMLKLLKAEKDINTLTLKRKHGDWVDVPKPNKVDISTPTANNFTMKQAVALYLKSLDKNLQDEYKAKSTFLNNVFLELVGYNTDASSIDIDVLLDIREILSLFPRRNIQMYAKMPITDIITLVKGTGDISGEHVIATRTLNRYIAWFTAVFVYADNHGKIPRNPARNLKLKINLAEDEEREPFSSDELLQISTLLPNDLRKVIVNILYFTGMRLSEVFKATIKEVRGVYIFDLTDKKVKLKTKNSYRVIPLHKKLLEINVPDVFEEIQKSYTPNYMSSWFNSKLLRPYVTKDKRKVLYSLRHGFASALKNKRISESVIAELMGHEQSTMALRRYAEEYEVEILKEDIDNLDFDLL